MLLPRQAETGFTSWYWYRHGQTAWSVWFTDTLTPLPSPSSSLFFCRLFVPFPLLKVDFR